MNFIPMVVAPSFFPHDDEAMAGRLRELPPMEREHQAATASWRHAALTAGLGGMIVGAGVQGALAGLGYWLIGTLAFTALLGFLTGLASRSPGRPGHGPGRQLDQALFHPGPREPTLL
jgi:predicted PurR-regulated permease PerM